MSWKDGPLARQWIPILELAEGKYSIPAELLCRQCYEESRFDPGAHNMKSGAVGLMQLLPRFFPGAGIDPTKDIDAAGAYLAKLFKEFKDWQLALAAYDWGPGNLKTWLRYSKILSQMPKETQNYVAQIISDIPIQGALCKIPSPLQTGSLTNQSLEAPSLEPPLHKSWLQSAITSLKPHSTLLPAAQSLAYALPAQPISFPTTPTVKENLMSTPSPVLVAASPFLKSMLTNLKTAISTTLTGDPLQVGLRAGPAFAIFLNQVILAEPSLASAEEGVISTDINSKIDGLIAKLP